VCCKSGRVESTCRIDQRTQNTYSYLRKRVVVGDWTCVLLGTLLAIVDGDDEVAMRGLQEVRGR